LDSLDIKEFEKLLKLWIREPEEDLTFADMLFKTKEDHDREIAAKKKKIREALEKEI